MTKIIFIQFFIFLNIVNISAQNSFKGLIKDVETKESLAGAIVSLEGTENKVSSDAAGLFELKNIPGGKQTILINFIGYETEKRSINFPVLSDEIQTIYLGLTAEETEEIIISSTRTSRTIEDIPTRVEAITGEELNEKANMKPGDIRMLLSESTGIQTQQTSATSFNSSIRIQGLDGKYTQIIRDGFPLYSNFSGGLGLLQIVPLDLKQVEIIKGSSSTLYGGDAIAGLVNLISKSPGDKRELNFLINGTSSLELDVSGFYSQKFKKTGTTIFASYNHGTPYDPANIGLTAVPRFDRFTFNPKLFLYLGRTNLDIGINATIEERIGGDVSYIKGDRNDSLHSYFETNKTKRFSTQFSFEHSTGSSSKFNFKNSFSYYDRSIEIPGFTFAGKQFSSFSEASVDTKNRVMEWTAGINFITDKFRQEKLDTTEVVDYNYYTIGSFVENTWETSKKITIETGLRADYQHPFGFFLLPHISGLFKLSPALTSRISGGFGYKVPTVFTEDAEKIQFMNVMPVTEKNTNAERSVGGSVDINYRTGLFSEKVSMSVNQLFFYTKINNPLILTSLSNGNSEYLQPDGFIDTKGIETNVKFIYKHFKLFIGYTFTDVNQHYEKITEFPLVAKHRLNNVLMYEVENKFKAGLEAYYFSRQLLTDGTEGRAHWVMGFMVEKFWDHFSLYINFENFLDTRQTKFGSIYTGTLQNPIFKDIYAPLEGFVFNGGIKLKL